jgi:putative hydrolase of the HAD superfamily
MSGQANTMEAKGEARPDLRHVRAWIFDLDNTLYSVHSDVFTQIDARMTAFVQRHFGIAADRARDLQKTYYREHGTTLNGLMRVNGIDPEAYLSFVHDIDLSAIPADTALEAGLARLPGRRFVFTNGCRNHAARVLEQLELTHLFDEVWDIRTIGYVPKPERAAYELVLKRAGAPAAAVAMFDDMARNLVPAHALGMTTVWLKNDAPWSRQGPQFPIAAPVHIHHETDDLASFLQSIRIRHDG